MSAPRRRHEHTCPGCGAKTMLFAAYQKAVLLAPEGLCIGWLNAAVRLFVEHAGFALDGFDGRNWPGEAEAERILLDHFATRYPHPFLSDGAGLCRACVDCEDAPIHTMSEEPRP